METLIQALWAFGPLSGLGIIAGIFRHVLSRLLPLLPNTARELLIMAFVFTPLLVLLYRSTIIILNESQYVPLWMGVVFFGLGVGIGAMLPHLNFLSKWPRA